MEPDPDEISITRTALASTINTLFVQPMRTRQRGPFPSLHAPLFLLQLAHSFTSGESGAPLFQRAAKGGGPPVTVAKGVSPWLRNALMATSPSLRGGSS